jgi:hypothetical protein
VIQPPVEHYMATPNPVAFGSVPAISPGWTPAEIVVTITNDGSPSNVGTPTVAIVGDPHFRMDTTSAQFTCGQSAGNVISWVHLSAGQSCTVPVEVDLQAVPFDPGPIAGTLRAFGAPSVPGPLPILATTALTATLPS